MTNPIPTYIVNLPERKDRLAHVLEQFEGRDEFSVEVVAASKQKVGAVGLWNTLVGIIEKANRLGQEFVLICEDDHRFTVAYSEELLRECIRIADEFAADILSGGASWVESLFQMTDNLFFMEEFTGAQFVIVFKRFYQTILSIQFSDKDSADLVYSAVAGRKLLIHPFISTQKEFGYSDVTPFYNDRQGYLTDLFNQTANKLDYVKMLCLSYQDVTNAGITTCNHDDVCISTYFLWEPPSTKESDIFLQEFSCRDEFEVQRLEPPPDSQFYQDWAAIRQIVQKAIDNKDEVVIICGPDHRFTDNYSKDLLFRNIRLAFEQGADMLVGGLDRFGFCFPASLETYWVNSISGAPLKIIFERFFNEIMNAPFTGNKTPDELLSSLSSNKMTFYPFISRREDAGAASRLSRLHEMYLDHVLRKSISQ